MKSIVFVIDSEIGSSEVEGSVVDGKGLAEVNVELEPNLNRSGYPWVLVSTKER